MTAFASRSGSAGGVSWSWEMRGVNARGLDLRLRLPDGVAGIEPALRTKLSARLTRGAITLTLRLTREEAAQGLALDEAQLERVLDALGEIEQRALSRGLTLAQPTAADVLGWRGVVSGGELEAGDDGAALARALEADVDGLLDAFVAMRAVEGAALHRVIAAQLDVIGGFVARAADLAEARRDETRAGLTAALRRVAEDVAEVDEARLAQELALLAVKQDVTEELDRLRAHVTAALALLAEDAPVGRRLDFLAQEFNREANTLCAKSQSQPLTAVGLELKAAIEQMREQIQNVE
ncbi:yicC family protein [Oceanicola granulosus HTCC2516]|uniref:YicC family protein n=1 Tax=Oceanicola granulosus (strain ATCC BAA-861 / DSM 15982 / KCTC 12143 / HTCC2516) TaxID=314256 RepID=Q2CE49_OCEGH|nr:yicC family protein [Oceanicola granulosus HTCC2516]